MVTAGEVTIRARESQTRLTGYGSKDPGVPVDVRLLASGLPQGIAVWGEIREAQLVTESGEIRAPGGWVGFGDAQAIAAASGGLRRLDQRPGATSDSTTLPTTLAYLRPDDFERLAGRPVTYRCRLRLIPYRYVQHAEVPFAAAAGTRLRRGSYRAVVVDVVRSSDRVGVHAVERDVALRFDGFGRGMRRSIPAVKLLKNTRRGEALRIDTSRSGGEMTLALKGSRMVTIDGGRESSLVTPAPEVVRGNFEDFTDRGWWWQGAPGRTWFDEATLVWLKRIEGRPIEVDLTIEDLVLRREDLDFWRSHRSD
jgi:hypothetical protein